MIAALADLTLVVVDVETTGWLHEQAELTEIGAVRVHDGRVVAEFDPTEVDQERMTFAAVH